jgi:hypothetical protein
MLEMDKGGSEFEGVYDDKFAEEQLDVLRKGVYNNPTHNSLRPEVKKL